MNDARGVSTALAVTRLTRTMRSLPPVHAPRLRALIDDVRGTVTSPDPAVLPRVTHPVRDRTSLLPAAPSANPAVLPPHAGVSAATPFRHLVSAITSSQLVPRSIPSLPAVSSSPRFVPSSSPLPPLHSSVPGCQLVRVLAPYLVVVCYPRFFHVAAVI